MLLCFLGLISPGKVPEVESVNVFVTLDIKESDGLINQQGKLNLFSAQTHHCGSGAQTPFCSKHGGHPNKFVALQHLSMVLAFSTTFYAAFPS